jgi:HEAT repeat protein
MPEPIYQQDSSVSTEQRISDAAFRAVRGETPQTRAAALGELAVIGDVSVLDTLSQALADPEPQVQLAAVTAARRLAQYHGDENGEVEGWLIQAGNGAGNSADPRVAVAARDGANELAQNQGQDLPFP